LAVLPFYVLDGQCHDNSSDDVEIRTTLECVTEDGQVADMGRVEGARIYQYPIDSVLAEKGYSVLVTARLESCFAIIVLVNAVEILTESCHFSSAGLYYGT